MRKCWIVLASLPLWAQQPGPEEMPQQLVWLDRAGKTIAPVGQPQMSMYFPEISPDGRHAAVSARDGETNDRDVWIHDLSRGSKAVLAPAKGNDNFPIWTADGRDIVFTSSRPGNYELFRAPFQTDAPPKMILKLEESQYPRTIVKDTLIFTHATEGKRALMAMPATGGAPKPFLPDAKGWCDGARVSPDGRYVAYVSNGGGPWEVYVTEASNPSKSWKVSRELKQGWAGGGGGVRWRRNGKELFYMMGDAMVSVEVDASGPDFKLKEGKKLFSAPGMKGSFPDEAPWLAKYDVSAEGDRFLFVRAVPK